GPPERRRSRLAGIDNDRRYPELFPPKLPTQWHHYRRRRAHQLVGAERLCRRTIRRLEAQPGVRAGRGCDWPTNRALFARVEPNPDRHRLSERAVSTSRLFSRVWGRRGVKRRDELAAVYRSSRKTWALLFSLCKLPHPARSRLRAVLCRNKL